MNQRLRQLGGSLRVNSTGHGTMVCAWAPIGDGQKRGRRRNSATFRPSGSRTNVSGIKRILIADDHEVTRHGIRALLAEEKDFEICGEAADGLDAIARPSLCSPT